MNNVASLTGIATQLANTSYAFATIPRWVQVTTVVSALGVATFATIACAMRWRREDQPAHVEQPQQVNAEQPESASQVSTRAETPPEAANPTVGLSLTDHQLHDESPPVSPRDCEIEGLVPEETEDVPIKPITTASEEEIEQRWESFVERTNKITFSLQGELARSKRPVQLFEAAIGGPYYLFEASKKGLDAIVNQYAASIPHPLLDQLGRVLVMPAPGMNLMKIVDEQFERDTKEGTQKPKSLREQDLAFWKNHRFFKTLFNSTTGPKVKHLLSIGGVWDELAYQNCDQWEKLREKHLEEHPNFTVTKITDWEDFGVAGMSRYNGLVENFAKQFASLSKNEAVACHCKAGLGRTGTLDSVVKLFCSIA